MFDSLTTQYLLQAPDYHPISFKEGCISGCASGISPVLELDQRVLVNKSIVQRLKTLKYQDCESKMPSDKPKLRTLDSRFKLVKPPNALSRNSPTGKISSATTSLF